MAASDLAITATVTVAAAALLSRDYRETPFDALFESEAKRTGVPSDLLRAIARQESTFNAGAVSPVNRNGTRDYGLMQVNEATARAMGRDVGLLLVPAYNVAVAADYLRAIKRELGPLWSEWTWVAAYNAGSPAIRARGVFNVAYASAVTWHLNLYRLAGLMRARGL